MKTIAVTVSPLYASESKVIAFAYVTHANCQGVIVLIRITIYI